MYRNCSTKCSIATFQLLTDDSKGIIVHPASSIFFGNAYSHQAEICQLLHDCRVKRTIAVPFLDVWHDFLINIVSNCFSEHVLFFGKLKMHLIISYVKFAFISSSCSPALGGWCLTSTGVLDSFNGLPIIFTSPAVG